MSFLSAVLHRAKEPEPDLEQEKRWLGEEIDFFRGEIAYITEEKRVADMRKLLLDALEHRRSGQIDEGNDDISQVKRQWILARKNREFYYRRDWNGMILALGLLVLFSIGLLLLWLSKDALQLNTVAPLFAALAGGIGGCTAVLIQAIDVDPETEAVSKFTWYVIKPVLGAALGFITYFVVVSTFNLLANGAKISNYEGTVVIGFLAGFFESFSTGLLARVAGQITGREAEGTSSPPAKPKTEPANSGSAPK